MNKELKPCPFCGKKAETHEDIYYCKIKCSECGAESGIVRVSARYCAVDKVTEAWNRRAEK